MEHCWVDDGSPTFFMLTLCPACTADWPSIVAVQRRAAACERQLASLDSPRDILDLRHSFRGNLHVAVAGTRITGFVSWARTEICWLYVDPRRHRTGIGETLLRYALGQIGEIAHIRVLVGNAPMIALCTKLGFVETDDAMMDDPPSLRFRRLEMLPFHRLLGPSHKRHTETR